MPLKSYVPCFIENSVVYSTALFSPLKCENRGKLFQESNYAGLKFFPRPKAIIQADKFSSLISCKKVLLIIYHKIILQYHAQELCVKVFRRTVHTLLWNPFPQSAIVCPSLRSVLFLWQLFDYNQFLFCHTVLAHISNVYTLRLMHLDLSKLFRKQV